GAGIRQVEYGRGIDAFQALTMALEGVRYFLDRLDTPLVWGGVLDDDSGFQRVIPLLPERGGTARLERMVDRELLARMRKLERRHRAAQRRRARRAQHSAGAPDWGIPLQRAGGRKASALRGGPTTPPVYLLVPLLVPGAPYAPGGGHCSVAGTWVERLGQSMGLAGSVRPAFVASSASEYNYPVGAARAREDGINFNLA